MRLLKPIFISLACLILPACGPDKSPPPKLFEEQRNALEQAKAVSNAAEQQAQDLQKNVDKASQ